MSLPGFLNSEHMNIFHCFFLTISEEYLTCCQFTGSLQALSFKVYQRLNRWLDEPEQRTSKYKVFSPCLFAMLPCLFRGG